LRDFLFPFSVLNTEPTLDSLGANRRFVPFPSETVLFRDLGVDQRISLCDVQEYISAQILDLLKHAKYHSFPPREPSRPYPEFLDGNGSILRGSQSRGFERG